VRRLALQVRDAILLELQAESLQGLYLAPVIGSNAPRTSKCGIVIHGAGLSLISSSPDITSLFTPHF
jgi:hypothetical protein